MLIRNSNILSLIWTVKDSSVFLLPKCLFSNLKENTDNINVTTLHYQNEI